MIDFINSCLSAFIRRFVAVDDIGVLPIFYSPTEGPSAANRRLITSRLGLPQEMLHCLYNRTPDRRRK